MTVSNMPRRRGVVDLCGRVALVTGANKGLGQAIALALAAAGADLAMAGRTPAIETGEQVRALGRKAVLIDADVAGDGAAHLMVDGALATLGRLDILVNNAGIIRRGDAATFGAGDWDAVIDTNLTSLFFLCQEAGRHMLAQGSGKIVNIASMLSFQGGLRVPAYTAAKSAVAGLPRRWPTSGRARASTSRDRAGLYRHRQYPALQADETRNRQILERIPAGRWGAPSDIGGAAGSWRHPPPITSMAISWRWMAAAGPVMGRVVCLANCYCG